MNIHWKHGKDWRFELAPVLMALGAGILLMVGEEFAGMLIFAVAMVLEFLDVEAKPKKKKVKKLDESDFDHGV